MVPARTALFVVALPLAGCASTVDIAYLITGPRTTISYQGPAVPAERVDRWLEVALDPRAGLLCTEARRPRVRRAFAAVDAEDANGYRLPMQFATALDAAALTGIAVARETTCAGRTDCGSALLFYSWLLPLALDLGWGIYRSVTIHPQVYQAMHVEWSDDQGDEVLVTRAACAPGTVVVLRAPDAGARVSLHIGAEGRLAPAELPALVAFVAAHGEIEGERADEVEVRLDTARRAEVLAAVPVGGAGAAGMAAPGPAAPVARARATIEWRLDAPVVTGVPIDFPMESVCAGDAACPRGLRCRDRGDGVPLCMGPGAGHRYCAEDRDCAASQRCTPRPADAVGMCGEPAARRE
jgi:hypothetical protein